MNMWSWISVALSGYISIYSYRNNDIKQAIIFKLMSLGLLYSILFSVMPFSTEPATWVLISLLVAMFADGLYYFKSCIKVSFIAFLCSQLLLSKAFWCQLSGSIVWWMPALLIASAIVAFFLLLPQLDNLIIPVALMGLVLIQMAWAAGEVWLNASNIASLMGFLGCITFILSWITQAIHDFKRPIKGGQYIVSGTYLLAQSLVVISVMP
ncbi:lysoplasmalogenase [Vibrio zhugei]|uniref:Lysoplasmalogenase n=1 Tax=Vibrio zhugei TaxID=2479546 RepID=A0ABV7CAT1_9VIBR|nr:lysoplasmalogenase [Vibrio zhugei]